MSRLRQALKRAYYFGTKYHCALCGARTRMRKAFAYDLPVLRELDVVGGERRESDNCPICFSGSRHRLVFEYLRREGLPQGDTRVLNIAPERGLYNRLMKGLPGYVALDMNPRRYHYIHNVQGGDVQDMSFSDGTFDLIICNHVLEHVPDDRRAMREIARVLAPGGRAILQVPISRKLEKTIEDPTLTDPKECERRFGQFNHIRLYGADYADRLAEAGLAVETIPAVDIVAPRSPNLAGVNEREMMFIARRA